MALRERQVVLLRPARGGGVGGRRRAKPGGRRSGRRGRRLAGRALGSGTVRRGVVAPRRPCGVERTPPTGRGRRARPAALRRPAGPLALRVLRRAASAGRSRSADGRADDPDARDARPDRAARAADPRGPRRVVPAVQRAGRRLGSRGAHHPRGAGRRAVDHQRAEGVEQHGAARRTTACCSRAPTPTCRSMPASRGSRSRSTSPA